MPAFGLLGSAYLTRSAALPSVRAYRSVKLARGLVFRARGLVMPCRPGSARRGRPTEPLFTNGSPRSPCVSPRHSSTPCVNAIRTRTFAGHFFVCAMVPVPTRRYDHFITLLRTLSPFFDFSEFCGLAPPAGVESGFKCRKPTD